jgi:hypothetical protein
LPAKSEKHAAVEELFQSEVQLPAWTAALDAWYALEQASGFQTTGKALPPQGRPKAVSWWIQRARKDGRIPVNLDGDDAVEDYYEQVVNWWVNINPPWRKEGVVGLRGFEEMGLKQESGGDLECLMAGLNGLTSILACLWWWYRVAEVAEGATLWRKMLDDVAWVLTEKLRALSHKRVADPTSEEPPSKRARLE